MRALSELPRRTQRTTALLISVFCAFILALFLPEYSFLNSPKLHLSPRKDNVRNYGGQSPPAAPPAAGEFRLPPQLPPIFNATADSIAKDIQALIDSDRHFIDNLVARIKPDNATFANVIIPASQNANRISLSSSILTFYASVSTDKGIRDASNAADKKWTKYGVEAKMRQDYFDLIAAVYKNKSEWAHLDPESSRLLNFTYLDFMDNGLGLKEGSPERKRYRAISERINSLENTFAQNLNEDDTHVWLTRDELRGAPPDILAAWDKGTGENKGKLKVIVRRPETRAMTPYIIDADVRRRLVNAKANRVPQNVPLLKEAVELRDEGARLLGFPNHAAYVLQRRMLNSPKKVDDFLAEVRGRLTPAGKDELRNLTEYKKQDKERTDKNEDRFFVWDQDYYQTKFEKENFDINPQKVKEYFPSTVIIHEMLQIYAQLFGLQFNEVKGADLDKLSPSGKGVDITWHPDVQLFAVWDSEAEGGDFIGYLYLDIFPRDGKYGRGANMNLQLGFLDLDNNKKRHFPVTSLICNFPKPTDKQPSLMSHGDVSIMFHELGHGIHDLVSRTTYSYFHGTKVLWDFVEAPSQMLENWVWSPAVLKNISRHYSYLSDEFKQTWLEENNSTDAQQPEERMPDQMIERMIHNKNYGVGLENLRQIAHGIYDMTLHTPATHQEIVDLDFTVLYNQDIKNVTHVNSMETLIKDESRKWRWGHEQASFIHLMSGYDAGYYGYMK